MESDPEASASDTTKPAEAADLPTADSATGPALERHLQGFLPLDERALHRLPGLLGEIVWTALPEGGVTLSEALLARDTSVSVLDSAKGHGKFLVAHAGSDAERQAAVIIYYAAIASALVHHDRRITVHPYSALAASFQALKQMRDVIPSAFLRLFGQAHRLSRRRSHEAP